jgi:hypothetical protein
MKAVKYTLSVGAGLAVFLLAHGASTNALSVEAAVGFGLLLGLIIFGFITAMEKL